MDRVPADSMYRKRAPVSRSQKFPDPVRHTIRLSPKRDSYKQPKGPDQESNHAAIAGVSGPTNSKRAAMCLRIATAFSGSRASARAVLICVTRSMNDESLEREFPRFAEGCIAFLDILNFRFRIS
jgi:hypothetical protein